MRNLPWSEYKATEAVEQRRVRYPDCGEHATQNGFLNNQVLKKDWGFRGIVMSDWSAAHDGAAVANGGPALEMPSGQFMNAKTLLSAIQSGRVSESIIDQKVRRQADAVTLAAAEEGAALLKNDSDIPPLSCQSIHSGAVLGPDVYPAEPGESRHVTATPRPMYHCKRVLLCGNRRNSVKKALPLERVGKSPVAT